MTTEVGTLLTLTTIREESHPCNIALLTTAGITPNPRIQLTTFTTSPPMIPTAAAAPGMTTSALKTPVLIGRKFIRRKNHGILPRLETGVNVTRLPTLQSTLGPPMEKGHLFSYSVKEEQIGGRKGRVGTGTMGAVTVGEQTIHGSQETVVAPVANPMIGSVRILKMTVLNAMQKIGYGNLLRHGSHAAGVAKAIAIRTTDGTRIGTEAAGAGKKVGITINKDGISDQMIVT